MQTKLSALILTLILSSSAMGSIVRGYDKKEQCDLYRLTSEKAPRLPNESIITDKDSYGLSTIDMEVDFDEREVRVQLMANVVLGFNKVLTGSKVRILESNPEFKMLVNQLNKKILLLEKACVDKNNVLIYAKEAQQQK